MRGRKSRERCRPKPVAPGTLYFPFPPLVAGAMHVASKDGNVCAFHRAAQEIAGGIGVGHRVGVVDVEDQGKVKRINAGSQGFVQDAVAADVFEGDAAQLVLVEVVGGDGAGAQCADARDQDVPVGGVRPGPGPGSAPRRSPRRSPGVAPQACCSVEGRSAFCLSFCLTDAPSLCR